MTDQPKKDKRGGARKNSGRKPRKNRRVSITITAPAPIAEAFKSLDLDQKRQVAASAERTIKRLVKSAPESSAPD